MTRSIAALHFVETTIYADKVVIVFPRLAVIPQQLHSLCYAVLCRHHATVTVGTEIFDRIKAEAPCVPNAAYFFSFVLRSAYLTGVLDDREAALFCYLKGFVHVCQRAIKVDRQSDDFFSVLTQEQGFYDSR